MSRQPVSYMASARPKVRSAIRLLAACDRFHCVQIISTGVNGAFNIDLRLDTELIFNNNIMRTGHGISSFMAIEGRNLTCYKRVFYPIINRPMNSNERRKLLGQFIRLHRERTMPDAAVRRRRTPGLRREELAARAGIGVTWCAWIEQGREISVSSETLSRLSDALALLPAERAYLFELAGRRDPAVPQTTSSSAAPEAVSALVKALPFPAYGLDRFWNACCWNAPAEHLFAGWLGEGQQRNLLRYTFTSSSARSLLPDWELRAQRLLAEFRSHCARMLNDATLDMFTKQLCEASDLFARAWNAQSVSAREGGIRSFLHPEDGLLHYAQHTFSVAERTDHKLVVLVPDVSSRGA
jgi:hypothetical protein